MSCKLSIMATVAVLGLSLLASTDASARGHAGGHLGGGFHKGGYARISHGPTFRHKGGFKRVGGPRHHVFKHHHKKHVHHHHHKKRIWSVKLRRFIWTDYAEVAPVVSDAPRYSAVCLNDCDKL